MIFKFVFLEFYMDYKEKYQKIVDELVRKSFPELRERKIKIIEFPNIFIGESFATNGIKNRYIFINKKCRRRKLIVLRGQFAHELSHLVNDYLDKGFLSSVWHLIKKIISFGINTEFSRKIETQVDKETIRRNYRKERYSLAEDFITFYGQYFLDKKFYPRGYLSPEEIKSYAKKIGKW